MIVIPELAAAGSFLDVGMECWYAYVKCLLPLDTHFPHSIFFCLALDLIRLQGIEPVSCNIAD